MAKFKVTVIVKEQRYPELDKVARYLKTWYTNVANKHVGYENVSVDIEIMEE